MRGETGIDRGVISLARNSVESPVWGGGRRVVSAILLRVVGPRRKIEMAWRVFQAQSVTTFWVMRGT
jgi:hypothetical protein